MSEGSGKDCKPQEAAVEKLFNDGLHAVKEFDPDADPSYRGGVALEYHNKLSVEEAGLLPFMLSTKTSVKKICIWEMPLSAFRAAFDKLQDWGSLEELQILNIDCDVEDFDIDLSGAFKKLRVMDLHCEKMSSSFALHIANCLRESGSLQEFSLWYACGGDEGAALMAEALKVNNTLKKFTLSELTLTTQTLIAFAEALVVNTRLEMVDLFDTCPIDKEQVSFLFEKDLYSDVFKRIRILWQQDVLPELIRLLREDRHCSELSVSVTQSVEKDLLREFFDAVASNTTLRLLHFYPSDDCFEELADGIAYVIERTVTLKEIQNLMHVATGSEQQLVRMLEALKVNRSVVNFTTYSKLLTPEIATSLSELLAVNESLTDVSVCEYWGITPEEVETILGGLRKNYTLTRIMVSWDGNDEAQKALDEMEQLLKRNARLLDQAAKFVTGDCNDTEAADAFNKLRSSASLVNRLKELTGKTAEAVLCDLEADLARLSV
ncbi:hypothetical protein V5799_032124 [Amblyomma americanum]|uniref:Ran gtpase-activating protein n=1 Tax=Amblyomma americanum TaxID=6943 RepID=A0AAQ4DS48_AMBAM